MLDTTKVMTPDDCRVVIEDLSRRKGKRAARNLILFRLNAGCGMRQCEIVVLQVGDVKVESDRPGIRIRANATKGTEVDSDGTRSGKARWIPLSWDAGTLADIRRWKAERVASGAKAKDLFYPAEASARTGTGFAGDNPKDQSVDREYSTRSLRTRWHRIIAATLGPERADMIPFHGGRHTFLSIALDVGHSLEAVRDAAGHANIATTQLYLHAFDEHRCPDMFQS